MALPPSFLDELRARTPLPALVGRRVKLRRAGRDWTGCCPFHNEKSPSFHVYDDHFHCYGCGAHGDAITFVMQTGGGSFIEAVESLAAEAGLDVPKASPAQAQAERARLDLHDVLDRAQAGFVRRLHAPEGAAALAYLRGRGLSEATVARFGLGWSGDGRGGMAAELAAGGIEPERALEAGLLRRTEAGERRELFFGRVTFPIRDRRGRLISFGGRALGDAKPKYINGPDTAVFHKRQTLYALDLARAAAAAKAAVVVVEGYMDVIALHQAGFAGAVAPLGTALTEEHLGELWRLSPEPVLCFDGDAAGARAAERSVLMAMGKLAPGLTVSLVTLPAGEDPDSLVRAGGARAMEAVLAGKRPLAAAAFALLSQGVGTGPDERAALRHRLDAAAASIPDRTLASEYRSALRDMAFAARRRPAPAAAGAVAPRAKGAPLDDVDAERARLLTSILLFNPGLLHDVGEAYAGLALTGVLAQLRAEILHADEHALLDSATLLAHLQRSGTAEHAAKVLSAPLPPASTARPDVMPAEAEAEWWHIFGLMHRSRLQDEVAAAEHAFAARAEAGTQRRLIALRTALLALDDPDGERDSGS